jgi:hypothetical protein
MSRLGEAEVEWTVWRDKGGWWYVREQWNGDRRYVQFGPMPPGVDCGAPSRGECGRRRSRIAGSGL